MIPEILRAYPKLYAWVQDVVKLTCPDRVLLFLDPQKDDHYFTDQLLKKGVMRPLKYPNSYHVSTDPEDTARVEESTFICTHQKHLAGPTNNWKDPKLMKEHLHSLFDGCMQGRDMIIIPYLMGSFDSPYKLVGVEITDSPYVAINMRRMAKTGEKVLKLLHDEDFIPGIHSVGVPLKKGEKDSLWPCNPKNRVIAHFPESKEIFSFGSGYGGNALLGKKCLSLRIASYLGYKQGFLAEHMLICGIENPNKEKKYILAAFPSSCGKTNLAMLESKMPGWKITTVGDDIAWIHVNKQGEFRAINPEMGFFGVAPGTSWKTNPSAMRMIQKDTIFTNTGYTKSGDVYWEGLDEIPKDLMTWKHQVYDGKEKAAHPNSRFTTPLENCDRLDQHYLDPMGVKIDAILFGGRREQATPLVIESRSYEEGVYYGATLSSETTSAAKGEVGQVRQDPFAMLPFCGYNMGLYFSHWLEMGKKGNPPKIFQVNWFRKNKKGEYCWPGFSENLRVLKWIFERCDGIHSGKMTEEGLIPQEHELDTSNLNISFEELFEIDEKTKKEEKARQRAFFEKFGKDFPMQLKEFL